MIFSELYSVYYHTVAQILTAARPGVTEGDLRKIILDSAFSESAMTILPALRSGRWPLLRKDLTSVLEKAPTMPLTLLEKRWLKSLTADPRLALFGISLPELDGVEPLFTREDYRIFDQYADGDPYEDEGYIRNFRTLLAAIREKRPVVVSLRSRQSSPMWVRFFPLGLEYSPKDDKFRVLAGSCRFREFNLAKILTCEFYQGSTPWTACSQEAATRELTLLVSEQRNTLERAMLHFAHFEKRTQRREDGQYLLHLRYQVKDESELVIRVLSFGPLVRVIAPDELVCRIREKLIAQRACLLSHQAENAGAVPY